MIKEYVQQGDCLLFPLGYDNCVIPVADEIPKEAKILKGETVLHYGATGHHHKLTGGAFGIYELDGKRFLDVEEPTSLGHEEHKPFMLPKGKYELRFVMEKDHLKDLVRPVVD